jgi:hypothetical protein
VPWPSAVYLYPNKCRVCCLPPYLEGPFHLPPLAFAYNI